MLASVKFLICGWLCFQVTRNPIICDRMPLTGIRFELQNNRERHMFSRIILKGSWSGCITKQGSVGWVLSLRGALRAVQSCKKADRCALESRLGKGRSGEVISINSIFILLLWRPQQHQDLKRENRQDKQCKAVMSRICVAYIYKLKPGTNWTYSNQSCMGLNSVIL